MRYFSDLQFNWRF